VGASEVKRTQADVDRLTAELRLDCSQLDDLTEMNERATERIRMGSIDMLDYSALGYTIHNIYGLIENACFRIAKFFENGLSPDAWHKELLNRMLLDIPGIRPAFFTREEFLVMDELRGFRHVFRNLYSRPLDRVRLESLQEKMPMAIRMFKESVVRYSVFLGRMRESIED
jgi:hypothetical protein